MRLPVEDRHEVFALCSYVFLDLNTKIAAVLRYAIEPIEQHPLIFGASDRIWIDLRITEQVKRRLIEAKSLGAILLILIHQCVQNTARNTFSPLKYFDLTYGCRLVECAMTLYSWRARFSTSLYDDPESCGYFVL